jgi:hypothetical protein
VFQGCGFKTGTFFHFQQFTKLHILRAFARIFDHVEFSFTGYYNRLIVQRYENGTNTSKPAGHGLVGAHARRAMNPGHSSYLLSLITE